MITHDKLKAVLNYSSNYDKGSREQRMLANADAHYFKLLDDDGELHSTYKNMLAGMVAMAKSGVSHQTVIKSALASTTAPRESSMSLYRRLTS